MLPQQLREDLEQIVGVNEFFDKIRKAVVKHSNKQTKKDMEYSAKLTKQTPIKRVPSIQKV